MIAGLTLIYNRYSPAQITKELIEIISGAERSKGKFDMPSPPPRSRRAAQARRRKTAARPRQRSAPCRQGPHHPGHRRRHDVEFDGHLPRS